MKQLFWLMLLAIPFSLRSQQNATQGIQWTEGLTWDQVKQKAKEENKFIFVDAFATWCGPCKIMDMEVYPDKKVGEVLNHQFVSVKVQMDQTPKDNDQIKKWYLVAQQFNQEYTIGGYPSFLFFNPEGKLVHKALGFRNAQAFVELTKDALTDPETRYTKWIEKFKQGQLDYESMPDLALQALSKNDRQTAIEIAKTFKERYLDKLTDEEAFQKRNLGIFTAFSDVLLSSNDRYFKLFYKHPDLADSIMGEKLSREFAFWIIRKEEINDKIYRDGKPITSPKPKWKSYEQSIKKKYGEKHINKIFPDDQITFYALASDWKNYVKYVNKKIKKIPPQVNGSAFNQLGGDAYGLNHYAWLLFLFCSDKIFLEKGLAWVDMAVKLDTSVSNAGYYDTKANLLYRMGKVKEAIELEEFAVIRSKSDNFLVEYLRKMKAGLPTWVRDKKKD